MGQALHLYYVHRNDDQWKSGRFVTSIRNSKENTFPEVLFRIRFRNDNAGLCIPAQVDNKSEQIHKPKNILLRLLS